MPLHLDLITDNKPSDMLAGILQKDFYEADSAVVNKDKTYFTGSKSFVDKNGKDIIGKAVISGAQRTDHNEVIDVDIVLKNNNAVEVEFCEKYDESSETTEVYEVECDDVRFEVETVNRIAIEGEILNTKQKVYLSAFPFKVSLFNNIDEFNEWAGVKKPIQVGDTDIKVSGFSETFMGCGTGLGQEVPCTNMIGKIENIREIKTIIGGMKTEFIIAYVRTAVGVIPTCIKSNTFKKNELQVGKLMVAFAYMKADFVA